MGSDDPLIVERRPVFHNPWNGRTAMVNRERRRAPGNRDRRLAPGNVIRDLAPPYAERLGIADDFDRRKPASNR
jgi:hypothetical protein